MQIVIDVPEPTYNYIHRGGNSGASLMIDNAIKNGTPLPKGHGRLIDVDEVIKIADKTKDLHGAIWNAQTIIEAESEDKE